LYKKILAGSFKFPTWISEQAKNLIGKMLVVNPEKRATIAEIVGHPWFSMIEGKRVEGIDARFYKIPIEISIVNQISNMGHEIQNLVYSIEKNIKSK
jgi:serine/threonine protein kinase